MSHRAYFEHPTSHRFILIVFTTRLQVSFFFLKAAINDRCLCVHMCVCVILLKFFLFQNNRKKERNEKSDIFVGLIFTYARHRRPHIQVLKVSFDLLSRVATTLFFSTSSLHYLSLDQFTNNSMEFHMQYIHLKLWSFRLGDIFFYILLCFFYWNSLVLCTGFFFAGAWTVSPVLTFRFFLFIQATLFPTRTLFNRWSFHTQHQTFLNSSLFSFLKKKVYIRK